MRQRHLGRFLTKDGKWRMPSAVRARKLKALEAVKVPTPPEPPKVKRSEGN